MYERKIPLDISCGIRLTMSIIGGKWKACLLAALSEGPKRPSELHKEIPEATPRVLNEQLKELEVHNAVRKVIYPELPPRSEYFITDLGKSLLPLIDAMDKWGSSHRLLFENKENEQGL